MGAASVAQIGHNNPPDPIDEAVAPHGDVIAEAENWLDGEPVTTPEQMQAVDTLTKGIKAALKAVTTAEASAAKPLHDKWKAEKARWKPTIEDLTRIRDGLVSLVADFKRKLERERQEAERKAREESDRARREAERAAREANAGNIEDVREAATAQANAEIAQAQLAAASKQKVTGMRKVVKYEITDPRALVNWIARNDRPAMSAFIEEWARRNHKTNRTADGLNVWDDREAF